MATLLSPALLEILVCPVCYQPVELRRVDGQAETSAWNTARTNPLPAAVSQQWLRCRGCGLCYPIQDGIPVMLEERATREPPLP